MLRKLLSAFGNGKPAARPEPSAPPYAPYRDEASNRLYHLLFCDDPAAFAPRGGTPPSHWQSMLFDEPVDRNAVAQLARDPSASGRVRALACLGLRRNGLQAVPPRQLLGVIVELALPGGQGLDALAAYSDGAVHHIAPDGKPTAYEDLEGLQPVVNRLLMASHAITDGIAAWRGQRRPPPPPGHVRLSFLMSDGLYLAEGPAAHMHRDPVAGPVFQRATELLQFANGVAQA